MSLHLMWLLKKRVLCVVVVCAWLCFVGVANAQSVRVLTDCSAGASWISNATMTSEGTIIMVGNLGQLGTYSKAQKKIAWECLPTQSFLFDVWSHGDTTVVVGEYGEVWVRIGHEQWVSVELPEKQNVRSVTLHQKALFVGTEQGVIWKLDGLSERTWTIGYEAAAAVIGLESIDGVLLAVGRRGGLYRFIDDWENLSSDESTYELTSIVALGSTYIVGSDHGQILRYNTTTQIWSKVAVVDAATVFESSTFLGRADKTLCVSHGAGDTLFASGWYDPRQTTGVRKSVDSGKTWTLVPFYSGTTAFRDRIDNSYCPLVSMSGDTIVALSCYPTVPTTIFRSTNDAESWDIDLTSTDILHRLDTSSAVEYGRCSTVVYAGAVLSGNEYLLLKHDRATNLEFTPAVPRYTYVVAVKLHADTGEVDTIAVLPGFFESLDEIDGLLYAGGDSGNVATSVDLGHTWIFEKVHDIGGEFAQVHSFVKLNGIVFAHAGWPTTVSTPWYGSGLIQLHASGWFPCTISPIGTNRVGFNSIFAIDGVPTILIYNLNEEPKVVGYALYKYDLASQSFLHSSNLPFGDTVTVFHVTGENPISISIESNGNGGAPQATRTCAYIKGDWVCDTLRLVMPLDTITLTSGWQQFDLGSVHIAYSIDVGSLYSTDGIWWRHLPKRMSFISPTIFFAKGNANRVIAGGPSNFAAEYTFDTTQTAVEGFDNSTMNQCANADLFGPDGAMYSVYEASGRLVRVAHYRNESDIRQDPTLRNSALYLLLPSQRPECAFWIFR